LLPAIDNAQLMRSVVVNSRVATLLLWKCTGFHDKKTLDSQKALDYTNKLTHTVKMPRKCVTMPTIEIVQLSVN